MLGQRYFGFGKDEVCAILGDSGADKGGEGKSKRAEKHGTKKSKDKFSATNQKPERRRPFETGLVRHCPQELFSPSLRSRRLQVVARYFQAPATQATSRRSLLFFVPCFSARLHFPSSPLSAPGSPRMSLRRQMVKPLTKVRDPFRVNNARVLNSSAKTKLLSAQIFYPCENCPVTCE